ncbi:Calx-beta domain-containing protein [Myxosarcina sp. GI1]|uniref:Calx-beta domain-containing protein n=1 Tax=Myxosarcina sp. GI1 TaxID=1541065 RepID=UPI00068BA463|nr:Calx-beta domain-containing protein [Myxosarcina sp. GI1]
MNKQPILIKDINPGTNNSSPEKLTVINDTLYFTANDGNNNRKIWKSDGTLGGTVLAPNDIKNDDLVNPADLPDPYFKTDININGTRYFTDGYELRKSEISSNKDVLIKELDDFLTNIHSFTEYKDTLYFVLEFGEQSSAQSSQLWKSDGTSKGTVLVEEFYSYSVTGFTEVDDSLFFNVEIYDGESFTSELWKSDGTTEGTVIIKSFDISSSSDDVYIHDLTKVGNALYFTADDGNGRGLWQSDGTSEGTMLLEHINPNGNSDPNNLIEVNGNLYFTADDGVNGVELWSVSTTTPPTIAFETAKFDVEEGKEATITLTRNGEYINTVSLVNIDVEGGTATIDDDFNNNIFPQTVSFAANEVEKSFTLSLVDDTKLEQTETIELTITAEDNAVVANDNFKATVNISDNGNDTPPIVYRFFNPTAGAHFYTADKVERDYVRDNLDNYDYEGESYVTVDPVSGSSPEEVYRFFNSTTGVHLYTTDENERDYIINNLDNFAYENIKFHAYETEIAGTVPIYRFYEPTIGVHFYTPNEDEKTYVENNLSNYTYEGIAYYAFPISDV